MKKGFTLIEILAVIVLLAVITLIITPMIYAYIKQSKSEAFESGVQNVFDSVNAYMSSNENLKEISVTDDSLGLKNSTYTSGTVFINSEGSLEAENVSDGTFCASGVKNELNVSEANNTALPCSGLDITPPTLELRVNSRTASSITFLAVGEDRQSGILGYSYSLDQNTWSTISSNSIIIITGLSKSEEVTLYVKAYNINYDGTNEAETVTLKSIVSSTLAVDEIDFEVNTNESNTVKTLTIIYPDGEYTYSYSINDALFINTTDQETDLVITENQKITARITYGSEITEKTITIEGIDSVGPVAHIEYSSTWQASKTIAVIIDEETSGLQTKSYSFDGGRTWQMSNTKVYASNETLINKIKVRDKLGNITSTFRVCVDGICGTETNNIVINYIDATIPVATWIYNGTTATITCSDTQSGVALDTPGTSYVIGGTSTINQSYLCRDKVGNSNSSTKTFVYSACKTGAYTCVPGYDVTTTTTTSYYSCTNWYCTSGCGKCYGTNPVFGCELDGGHWASSVSTCSSTNTTTTNVYNPCKTGINTCVAGFTMQ